MVKVRGLKYLNRALHLDTVVIKLIDWVIWENAQLNLTKNIDFNEKADDDPYQNKATKQSESQALPTSERDNLFLLLFFVLFLYCLYKAHGDTAGQFWYNSPVNLVMFFI